MASGDQYRFIAEGTKVPPRQLTPVALREPAPPSPHVHVKDTGLYFDVDGWYEVLLRVAWPVGNTIGTRFSHTQISDREPLHSEAIAADVLMQLSGGEQRLRANSLFGPDRTSCLVLEVWHDAPDPLVIKEAELIIRELDVPRSVSGEGGI